MTSNETARFIDKNKMQLLLLSITTIITIANLYITSILVPIKTDIITVKAQTASNSEVLKERQPVFDLVPVINTRLMDINKRLTRIEDKLDGIRR